MIMFLVKHFFWQFLREKNTRILEYFCVQTKNRNLLLFYGLQLAKHKFFSGKKCMLSIRSRSIKMFKMFFLPKKKLWKHVVLARPKHTQYAARHRNAKFNFATITFIRFHLCKTCKLKYWRRSRGNCGDFYFYLNVA